MKRYFLTGLILLLPFAISLLAFLWLVDILTDPFLEMVQTSLVFKNHELFFHEHPTLALFISRSLILIFLFFFILFLGALGRKYVFSKIVDRLESLFLKVPIIRVIYKLCHEVTSATFSSGSKLFKETVLIPFPQQDSLAIGLVTGEIPPALKKEGVDIEMAVFVPTSPHPMSGFILLTPKKLIKPVDLSTEEAFQYIISCGTMSQTQQKRPDA